jgi:hypothetical protein
VKRERTVEVNIPAGIDDGQTFILRGEGDKGMNNGPAGDLGVTVSVRPDTVFERDGYDIWCEIPLTYTQLTLGDEIMPPGETLLVARIALDQSRESLVGGKNVLRLRRLRCFCFGPRGGFFPPLCKRARRQQKARRNCGCDECAPRQFWRMRRMREPARLTHVHPPIRSKVNR